MAGLLRILLVEDNEDDAELVRRTLSRGEAAVELTRVEDEPSLRAALADGAWDAVIADYALPHFSAPEALAVVQDTGLDLPFIVASGTIGEDTAVAMMRAGAHDYLMKDKLARLLPAVEREIAEAQVRRERREAQAALQESLARYRSLYNAVSCGIVVEDAQCRIIEVNDLVCEMIGWSRESLLGQTERTSDREPIREDGTVFRADEHPTVIARHSGQPVRNVVMGMRHGQTGRLVWLQVNAEPLGDTAGRADGLVMSTLTDITALKESQERLRDSEERFRTIFDRSAVGITVTSMDGREVDCNPAMAAMLGMTRDEYLATDPDMLFHPEERDRDTRPWEELVAGKRDSYQRVTRLLHRDGHTVWVRLTVSLAAYGPAQETVALTMIEDITARKAAEQRLRESEEQYREMFEHMSSGVAVYEAVGDGEDFIFREFNAAAERIEGVNCDTLLGRPVSEVFPGAAGMGVLEVFRRV